jgi:hypothetical protein
VAEDKGCSKILGFFLDEVFFVVLVLFVVVRAGLAIYLFQFPKMRQSFYSARLDLRRYEFMANTLAKYHARAPRYILQPQENTLIRVAGPRQVPWEENTEIRNISLSGLAFTAPPDLSPMLGEVIKIQFQVPGSKQMACYGLVTRLEPVSRSELMVGVKFYKLDMPHRVMLAKGLSIKLRDQQMNRLEQDRALAVSIFSPKAVLPFALMMCWMYMLYILMFLNLK